MRKTIIGLSVMAIVGIVFAAFMAFASPDVCYAERPCKEGNVSCMTYGPNCDAEVLEDGVACSGFNDEGSVVAILEKCE